MLTETLRKSYSRINTGITTPGKLPPQAVDIEKAVLGALLVDSNAFNDVMEFIATEEVFYTDAHQKIWRAYQQLNAANVKIDLLTTSNQLQKNGDYDAAGGFEYLAELTNTITAATHLDDHARILMQKYLSRCIIDIATQATNRAYANDGDIFQLTETVTSQFDDISRQIAGQQHKTFARMVTDGYEQLQNAAKNPGHVTGVSTFSPRLDAELMGLQPGNLVVIAGRPGMGKTSVAWHIALQQARNGIPVGFFSLEMSDSELIQKMFCAETGVDTQAMRSATLNAHQWQQLGSAIPRLCSYPLHVNDRAGIGINQLVATARNWVRKQGVQVIYIDYIAKIRTHDATEKFGTREQQVSYISSRLKDMARLLNIPVVVLSQLSREVEKRGADKRPILSDLRESGAIEQDADLVIFPYRPSYYGFGADSDGNLFPTGYTELDIAKYRNGRPGMVPWIFEAQYSRFRDCVERD